MGFFSRKPAEPLDLTGRDGCVRVIGLGYKREEMPRAFTSLPRLAQTPFVAVMKAKDPNEWNPRPIEVWVNGTHVGWISDQDAPRYWKAMRTLGRDVSCDCTVFSNGMEADFGGHQVSKITLALPKRLPE